MWFWICLAALTADANDADTSTPSQVPVSEVTTPEKASSRWPDHIQIYKPNYFLTGFTRETQVLFQFSFRYVLWPNDGIFSPYFAYTQRSFWLLYDGSSPFLENNYSPELVFRWRFAGIRKFSGFDQLLFGYQHESNGQPDIQSRSWDRLFVEQRYTHYFGTPDQDTAAVRAYLRLWWIFLKDEFNPDIEDFNGPGELIVELDSGEGRWGRFFAEGLFRKGGYDFSFDKGRVQLGVRWQPPFPDTILLTPGLYVQYFTGFTESLETYNIFKETFRVGLVFPG